MLCVVVCSGLCRFGVVCAALRCAGSMICHVVWMGVLLARCKLFLVECLSVILRMRCLDLLCVPLICSDRRCFAAVSVDLIGVGVN